MQKHLWVAVLACATACKKEKKGDRSMGSASPAAAIAADAAIIVDAAAASSVDAPELDAAASGAVTITKDGLSSLPDLKEEPGGEDELVTQMQSKLPGFTVAFDVMDTANGEEGYYSVKQGETDVARIVRRDDGRLGVVVMGSAIPTPEGVRTGDKVSAVAAKYPDLACAAVSGSELGLLQCRAAGLVFVVDAEKYKGKKQGKLDVKQLADMTVFEIAAGMEK